MVSALSNVFCKLGDLILFHRLGCVNPEDVPWIVQRLINDLKVGVHPLSPSERPFAMAHWRGRMGMTQEEMKELHSSFAGQTNSDSSDEV